jgi:hypothetical protein
VAGVDRGQGCLKNPLARCVQIIKASMHVFESQAFVSFQLSALNII